MFLCWRWPLLLHMTMQHESEVQVRLRSLLHEDYGTGVDTSSTSSWLTHWAPYYSGYRFQARSTASTTSMGDLNRSQSFLEAAWRTSRTGTMHVFLSWVRPCPRHQQGQLSAPSLAYRFLHHQHTNICSKLCLEFPLLPVLPLPRMTFVLINFDYYK